MIDRCGEMGKKPFTQRPCGKQKKFNLILSFEYFWKILFLVCVLFKSTFTGSKSIIFGSKTKGWISKRVFQENKAHQIFRKNEHFLRPDTDTYVCVSGGKKCLFFGKIGVICFLEAPVIKFALCRISFFFLVLTFFTLQLVYRRTPVSKVDFFLSIKNK